MCVSAVAAAVVVAAGSPDLYAAEAAGRTLELEKVERTSQEQALQERLERLAERLEEQRIELHVPGMAIAVVKDDKVILARGFGVADLETNQPADAHTLFAIGSSTKAFTAALIATLVDEGALDWDDAIAAHLAEFRLHDEEVAKQVTFRDALCHRTGLMRTDLLWIAGKASREEILEAVAEAELYAPFREKWQYNNVMYLAAGLAAANAAGTDWDAMLAERLLEPLGMDETSSTYAAAQEHARLARGYSWNEDSETFKPLAMRNLDSIGPAGSINSTVLDMAQWVRLQLNRGEIDGKRLISREKIEQMWTPCIDIGPDMKYALGWMVHTWNGKRLIEHGGNIDGYAAMVSLLPDENIGFVLLTNVSHTPLQSLGHNLVYDTLLGGDGQERLPVLELEKYVGKYHFAPMEDDFTVLVKDGVLAVDVPGQMVYELRAPDEQGKWYFALTDQIAVSFEMGDDGKPVAMKMYQAGLTFELPRAGIEHELEVNLEEVGSLLGLYQAADGPLAVRVLIQQGRLAVDVPGQMVYQLHQPDEQERWYFRVTDAIFVTFEEDGEGRAVMVMHQAGVATRFVHSGEDEAGAIPSVEQLLELVRQGHNTGTMGEMQRIRIVEDVHMVHQGIRGTVTTTAERDDRLTQHTDFGKFGFITVGLDDGQAWIESDIRPGDDDLPASHIDDIRMRHPLLLFGDWREQFDSVEIQPNETVDGRLMHVVRLTLGTVRRTVRIDAETGLIRSEEASALLPGIGRLSQQIRYEEYQAIGELMLPSRTVVENELTGRTVLVRRSAQGASHLEHP